eukprot:TRINITY_DN1396_c0_g1_i1.p1 TRINITY_DN1396_c0_g1~~TRINITY_DN1396_c0_g1_i1.p1  ORF type:complete len:198 (-),score=52.10 TRINITY_DN1396_c0_g1_i1:84-641(-)
MKAKAQEIFKREDKINGELLTLTYGSMVCQLVKDMDSISDVNDQLHRMGVNIGVRLIDEFLALTQQPRCKSWEETAEVISYAGFKVFLGVTGQITHMDVEKKKFRIVLDDNPLIDFVELPDTLVQELQYNNILCGIIEGALKQLQLIVECKVKQCPLRGDETTELSVKLVEIKNLDLPVGEEMEV